MKHFNIISMTLLVPQRRRPAWPAVKNTTGDDSFLQQGGSPLKFNLRVSTFLLQWNDSLDLISGCTVTWHVSQQPLVLMRMFHAVSEILSSLLSTVCVMVFPASLTPPMHLKPARVAHANRLRSFWNCDGAFSFQIISSCNCSTFHIRKKYGNMHPNLNTQRKLDLF